MRQSMHRKPLSIFQTAQKCAMTLTSNQVTHENEFSENNKKIVWTASDFMIVTSDDMIGFQFA